MNSKFGQQIRWLICLLLKLADLFWKQILLANNSITPKSLICLPLINQHLSQCWILFVIYQTWKLFLYPLYNYFACVAATAFFLATSTYINGIRHGCYLWLGGMIMVLNLPNTQMQDKSLFWYLALTSWIKCYVYET